MYIVLHYNQIQSIDEIPTGTLLYPLNKLLFFCHITHLGYETLNYVSIYIFIIINSNLI